MLTLTPWFGNQAVTAEEWNPQLPAGSESISWSSASWLSGGDSHSSSPGTYSSFTVFDKLVKLLEGHKRNGKLPNLKHISIAGFSAGCQMALRWAFFSSAENSAGIQVVVSDCGSYLYLNSLRPTPECTVTRNSGPDHKCDSFGQPDGNQSLYNQYKYGLYFTGPTNSYVDPFVINSSLTIAAIDAFPSKNVRFLFGKADVCMCGAAGMENDPDYCFPTGTDCSPNFFQSALNGVRCCDTYSDFTDNVADYSLGGMVQGSNRLQRGLNYVHYLQYFYAARGDPSYKATWGLFDGGHDSAACFRSPLFTEWVFGIKPTRPKGILGNDKPSSGVLKEGKPSGLRISTARVPHFRTWLEVADLFESWAGVDGPSRREHFS